MSKRVRNINDPSVTPCKCGSWINHWKKITNKSPLICSREGCMETRDLVGAHVQYIDEDATWYIVPLCDTHNKQFGQEFTIKDNVPRAPANKNNCP